MKIRLIQLMNNYYKDRSSSNSNPAQPLGEFCCFGYFDAMQSFVVPFHSKASKKGIKETVDEFIIQKIDGKSNCRTLICVTDKDEEDKVFWKDAENMPYLIVSIVRLDEQERGQKERISRLISAVNKRKHVITYYTYEQADLVIVKAARSYGEAIEFASTIRSEEPIYKMYSIFSARESVLQACKDDESYDGIEDEKIKCILRGSVKKMKAVDFFWEELNNILKKKGIHTESCVKKFHILGNNDILIEMNDVPVRTLLPLYSTGEILTHASNLYEEAFFNIESEFLIIDKKASSQNG